MDDDRRSDASNFGDVLRRHRLAAGLTQEELAERATMSVRGVSDLERGARTRPQRETLNLLAAALGLTEPERTAFLQAGRPTIPRQEPTGLAGVGPFPDAPLPLPATPLIGREETIAALAALFADPATRLLTLLGTAGIGKTRLAIATAERLRPAYPDGVAFVPLAALRDPDLVPGAVARALGVREAVGLPVATQIARALRDRRVLLVLDNLEQLLPAVAPWIGELLTACPSLSVLTTSRIPLRLTAERRFPVPALDVPPPAPADEAALCASSAVQLFLERANAIGAELDLTAGNAADVAAICCRLDGLPLAIELAAARTPLLSPAALLSRLDRRLPILSGGMQDAPARHQTLRQAIAWSYDLLNPDAQALFRRLGIFVGGWTLEAATAVAAAGNEADVFEGLASLAERQLIVPQASGSEPRFTMLETIREFALEHVAAVGEEPGCRERHAAFFLDFAEAAAPHLERATQEAWVPRLEADHANVRAAVEWFATHGRHAEILRIGVALWNFWFDWHPAEGLAWLEPALAAPTTDAMLRAAALHGAGNLARQTGDPLRGQAHHLTELDLRRSIGDEVGIGKTLLPLGVEAWELGDLPRAEALLAESAQRLRPTSDTWAYGIALSALAAIAADRGDDATASRLSEESLAIHRERGDQIQVAYELHYQGWYALFAAEYERARTLFEQSLAIDRAIGGPWRIRNDLEGLAEVGMALGDLSGAEDLLAESAGYAPDAGHDAYLPLLTGRLARKRGEHRRALGAYSEAHGLVAATRMHRVSVTIDYLSELTAFAVDIRHTREAIHLVAATQALRAASGFALSPHVRVEHERAVAALHTELGPPALDAMVGRMSALPREEVTAAGLAAAAELLAAAAALPESPQPAGPMLRLVPHPESAASEHRSDSPSEAVAAVQTRVE